VNEVRSGVERLGIRDFPIVETYQQDVILGLTSHPKFLQPKYFYDELGSQLFEAICDLPEYYPTRTEAGILKQAARGIFSRTGPCELVELGSGSSTKTTLLLDALVALDYPMVYVPVDVSMTMLKQTALGLINRYPKLYVQGIVADYEGIWAHLPPAALERRMVIFLGSTLGNFPAAECYAFLSKIAHSLMPGDYFLLGVDLQKPIPILEAAYNDQQGITAQFNLNVLTRLNQDFKGDFDLDQFEHWAFYNTQLHQIEMHLRSRIAQKVRLEALGLTLDFAAGETIHTESSRKFNLQEMGELLAQKSLPVRQVWQDPQGWFGLFLGQKI